MSVQWQYMGHAIEHIPIGSGVECDPSKGQYRRARYGAVERRARPVRLVRNHGNMYLPDRYELGRKFFYDVYDWGDPHALSMHLFTDEKSRDYYRRKVAKRAPLWSGKVGFKTKIWGRNAR